MILNNIKNKWVICEYGISSFQLVQVLTETSAKFDFLTDSQLALLDKFPDMYQKSHRQMKNTIVAVADTREELQESFDYLYEKVEILKDTQKLIHIKVRELRKENSI